MTNQLQFEFSRQGLIDQDFNQIQRMGYFALAPDDGHPLEPIQDDADEIDVKVDDHTYEGSVNMIKLMQTNPEENSDREDNQVRVMHRDYISNQQPKPLFSVHRKNTGYESQVTPSKSASSQKGGRKSRLNSSISKKSSPRKSFHTETADQTSASKFEAKYENSKQTSSPLKKVQQETPQLSKRKPSSVSKQERQIRNDIQANATSRSTSDHSEKHKQRTNVPSDSPIKSTLNKAELRPLDNIVTNSRGRQVRNPFSNDYVVQLTPKKDVPKQSPKKRAQEEQKQDFNKRSLKIQDKAARRIDMHARIQDGASLVQIFQGRKKDTQALSNAAHKKANSNVFDLSEVQVSSEVTSKIDTKVWLNQANIVTPDFKTTDGSRKDMVFKLPRKPSETGDINFKYEYSQMVNMKMEVSSDEETEDDFYFKLHERPEFDEIQKFRPQVFESLKVGTPSPLVGTASPPPEIYQFP